jgi:hypothetical protein
MLYVQTNKIILELVSICIYSTKSEFISQVYGIPATNYHYNKSVSCSASITSLSTALLINPLMMGTEGPQYWHFHHNRHTGYNVITPSSGISEQNFFCA